MPFASVIFSVSLQVRMFERVIHGMKEPECSLSIQPSASSALPYHFAYDQTQHKMSNTIVNYKALVHDAHYKLAWVDTSLTMPPWSTAKAEELLTRLCALKDTSQSRA
jgi:hypothetical protein